MKIIVTGGAGFIGSTLVKFLIKKGHKLTVIDNLWRGDLNNLKDENGNEIISFKKNFINADLTNYDLCLKHIKNADFVIHLADVVGGINFVFENEYFVYRQNVVMNANVLSATKINRVQNYIYVGTACSYPKNKQMKRKPTIFKEGDVFPAFPESSYGWSKLMGEYEAELVGKTGNINIGLLRFHNVYGPGSYFEKDRSQVIPALIRKAIFFPDEDFIVWGNGRQSRDFVYIDDIIQAIHLLIKKGMNKGVIQIGSGYSTSIKEVVDNIIAISNKDIKAIYDKTKPVGDLGRIANYDKAKELLNWSPKTDVKKGLEKTYRWISKQIETDRQ